MSFRSWNFCQASLNESNVGFYYTKKHKLVKNIAKHEKMTITELVIAEFRVYMLIPYIHTKKNLGLDFWYGIPKYPKNLAFYLYIQTYTQKLKPSVWLIPWRI